MKRSERDEAARLVGKAFRCSDGLVRWITHLSARGHYSLLWFNENSGTWFSGGIFTANRWREEYGDAVEVSAPQPGEAYMRAGATGVTSEYRA